MRVHHQIGSANGDCDADHNGDSAHHDVVAVGTLLVDERLVDVVGPHRGESAHVARHAAHEAGNQSRDAEAEKAGAKVADHHQRQSLVIAVQFGVVAASQNLLLRSRGEVGLGHGGRAARLIDHLPRGIERADGNHVFAHQLTAAAVGILQEHQAEQARQNHDKGHGHLEERTDDRSHARRAQVVRRENALDDEEVRGPIAEADHEAEAEDNAGPVHAHGVGCEVAGIAPEVEVAVRTDAGDRLHVGHDLALQAADAARLIEAQDRHQ